MREKIINCAIYTRKSTEEGLDQDFSSLDAQREACEAYITSQRSSGWRLIKTHYDDGGYSGANMERPGLKALISDIKAGKVQTVVVYKIDRLTRSLMDFSKLVEILDAHNVTFVSVTQSFNTTTSMGRLTLNMLLSFAQFEREVTGERIRDKIAASKKKGMWMGGAAPLGYKALDKKLVSDEKHKASVAFIFEQYLKCGSVRALKETLDRKGMRTPVRRSQKGRTYGGCDYSRGYLYKLLSNPIYIGKVQHKGAIYDGQHEAIIEKRVFKAVQDLLKSNAQARRGQSIKSGSLLKGLLFDESGTIYSPTYTLKNNKRYRYYISQNLLQYRDHPKAILARLPAHELEQAVINALHEWAEYPKNWQNAFSKASAYECEWLSKNPILHEPEALLAVIYKISVLRERLVIDIDTQKLGAYVKIKADVCLGQPDRKIIQTSVAFKKQISNNGAILLNPQNQVKDDPFNVPLDQLKRVVRGTIWRKEHFAGALMKDIAKNNGFSQNYIRRCIHESFDFLMQSQT